MFNIVEETKDLDLEKPVNTFLKNDIAHIYIMNEDSIAKSEFKVVTIIDLLTSVAGVPSFLFIIYKYFLKHFESFYSDV